MNHFFQILDCPPNATPEEIRKAWRKKCREHHPDAGGDVNMFLQITHAYKMLTDPSYQQSMKGDKVKDLTFRVQISIDFLEAFYGTKLTVNFNRIQLDHKMEQVKDQPIEPISIVIEVPPGSTRGLEHRAKDMGVICGHQCGDALILINVRRHPRYHCSDIDVYCDEDVPLDVMLKGGEVVVDTLWGHKVIWIPPGTCPGDKIRIYESGVRKKGYQYSTIKPVFPKSQDLKKETWKGLNINWEQADAKNKEDDELLAKFDALRK